MAGGFDEKAGGGAQMGVMQGPMVSKRSGPYFITARVLLYYMLIRPRFHRRFQVWLRKTWLVENKGSLHLGDVRWVLRYLEGPIRSSRAAATHGMAILVSSVWWLPLYLWADVCSLFPLHQTHTSCLNTYITNVPKKIYVSFKNIQRPWRNRAPLICFSLLRSPPPTPPSPATTTQRRLSLVSEDFLLSICGFFSPLAATSDFGKVQPLYSHVSACCRVHREVWSPYRKCTAIDAFFQHRNGFQILQPSSERSPFESEKVRRGKRAAETRLIASVECDMLFWSSDA